MNWAPQFVVLSSLAMLPVASAHALQQDSAITIAGVTMAPTVEVAGHQLVLDGAALRKKFVVKVYVAGLYLPQRNQDASAILAADTPRQLRMQFTYNVGREKMCEAWNESLENNSPGADAQLQSDFKELCGFMQDLKKGDTMVFTYVPGDGTTVEVQGTKKGAISGKPFADALFMSWIGPKPGPGDDFKKDLLGIKH
jgi:hypothetical protein